MFDILTRALFAAPLCIVATRPCDLYSAQTSENQQKGHHNLCSCLNSVRKRRSLSDVNSWRSYEQCLVFSCFVRSVHVNMGVRVNVRMPVGLASTALPFLVKRLCVWWVQRSLPFITSACPDHFEIHKHRSQPSTQFRVGCVGRLALELTISSKDSEHLGGLDPAKVCQDCLETIQRIATTRSTPKNWGMRTKTCSEED